jgi:predicted alpha/beta-hydrolase family hydrolase
MIQIGALVMCAAAFGQTPNWESKKVAIPTERGVELVGWLARPAEAGESMPAAVIAPGQNYDMDAPLIKGSFEELAKRGFVVVRFNWAFYSRKIRPSRGLAYEIDDLKAALAFCRQQPGVDPERVYVVGKSLGSLAAIQAGLDDESIAGVVLLTVALHPLRRPQQIHQLAAKLTDLKQPVLIITGDADPLCDLSALQALIDRASRKPELITVPGDHLLAASSAEATRASEEKAVSELTAWLGRLAER